MIFGFRFDMILLSGHSDRISPHLVHPVAEAVDVGILIDPYPLIYAQRETCSGDVGIEAQSSHGSLLQAVRSGGFIEVIFPHH